MEPLTLVDRNGTRLATVVPGTALVVGRSTECDITLPDPTVSRRHALIVLRVDRHVLLDDRSMNGTFLNGQRVQESELANGDMIELGSIQLRFVAVDA